MGLSVLVVIVLYEHHQIIEEVKKNYVQSKWCNKTIQRSRKRRSITRLGTRYGKKWSSLFLKGEFNIASLSNIIETWLKISQMSYRFEVNGGSSKIIIEHDIGQKYSYLIREVSRYLLEVAFEVKSSCDITANTIVIKLKQQVWSWWIIS